MPRTRQSRPTPQRTHRVTRRTPIESEDGGTQIVTRTTTSRGTHFRSERRTPISTGGSQTEVYTSDSGTSSNRGSMGRNVRSFSPTSMGSSAGGIGLLEAEFFGSLFMLVALMFANTQESYGSKIMSVMKRGTLLCMLFFILALIASIGPGSAKIAKALGAVVFVGVLLTSPGQNLLTVLDNFVKADWVGTSETGSDASGQPASADTGTASSGAGSTASKAANAAGSAAQDITQMTLPGIGPVFGATKVIEALKGLFHL